MADYEQGNISKAPEGQVETQDRGLFDFIGKKDEEKKQHEEANIISHEFEHKAHVSEPAHHQVEEDAEKKHEGLIQKLTRSDSTTSEEEVVEGGEKKKKKKIKDKIKEKISGEHKEATEVKHDDDHHHEDTSVPVEKIDEPEEKKGFLDKIKEKLPGGGQKKTEEVPAHHPPAPAPAPAPVPAHTVAEGGATHEGEAKEKKGILEKIKEKLPGYHAKSDDEKEKEGAH